MREIGSEIGFTGSPVDRADHVRQDAEALAAMLGDPAARLLRLTAGEPEVDAAGVLLWDPLEALTPGAETIFLGTQDGVPRFVAVQPDEPPAQRAPALFDAIGRMATGEAGTFAAARSLVDWHTRHRFCAVSGHATAMFRGGWGRKCPECSAEHFPRVDPVVIMIAEHDGRALLGRQAQFPPGRYSALAGFVEPGESVEEAVAREILEEAGVRVRNVRYVASQPWPFPSALMIACAAEAEDDVLTLDTTEIEDAQWFTREEVRAAMAREEGARFLTPPKFAIANTLLVAWLASKH